MKKILLIEDDVDLFGLLKYNLEKEGFEFIGSHTGRQALELCTKHHPDLILLDIMLPDSDGLDICKRIRKHAEWQSTPIVIMTARAEETDRIIGLELGGNDYITKPFFLREVIARIKVQLRPTDLSSVLRAGELELDRSRCEVRLSGKAISMTATEFRLLECVMGRPGVVFSREQLLNTVWGNDRVVTDRTVDVYILRLRQKLETDPTNPRLFRSVRGFGYSFDWRQS